MKIKIICLGKTKERFVKIGIDKYVNRISKYINLEWKIVADTKLTSTNTIKLVKDQEADTIIKYISEDNYLVALDEKGKIASSKGFAKFLKRKMLGSKDIIFIIGGVYGLSKKVLELADLKLSFSQFTFTHQMIRLLLSEQLYRALTIIHGRSYHY